MTGILFVIGHYFVTNENAIMFKTKTVFEFFALFLKCISNFERIEKNPDAHRLCISEISDFERRGCLNV